MSTNIFTVVGDPEYPQQCLALEALGDIIIVKEDKFRTGYECKVCDGTCYTLELCKWCEGTGKERDLETACRVCCAAHIETKKPGSEVCPGCHGKGGLIVAAQTSESRPTSGVVTSIGPEVLHIKVGDRVLYNLFSGTAINFKARGIVRVMHERETISKIYGLADIGDKVR